MTKYVVWIFPLLLLLLIAPFSSEWDLAISSYFYENGHFVSNSYIRWFYSYGEYVGLAVAMICGAIGVVTLYIKRWTFLTRGALVAMLTFVIGAGLFTNVLLKNIWGRPRPKQIEQFGGTKSFVPFYKPTLHFALKEDKQKSLPSGHASIGFFFLAFAVIGWRERRPWLLWLGVLVGSGMGINLSLIRIMQGGHFLTDTLVAAAIMWWTALAVTYYIYDRSFLKNWS